MESLDVELQPIVEESRLQAAGDSGELRFGNDWVHRVRGRRPDGGVVAESDVAGLEIGVDKHPVGEVVIDAQLVVGSGLRAVKRDTDACGTGARRLDLVARVARAGRQS